MPRKITSLRKNPPKGWGYREKKILNSKGARITHARDMPKGIYKIKSSVGSFNFTWKFPRYNDYSVVG